MGRIEMRASLIFIVIASCNGELYQIKTAYLPMTIDNRIQGGSPTTIEQYPFVVQVIHNGRFHCGASLVTTRHVLSAAHCFLAKNYGYVVHPSSCFIRVGTTFLNAGGSVHLVTAITIHERYNDTTKVHDVAVVLMAKPVDLTTSVARLAILPYQDSVVPDNSFVTAVGWGRTDAAIPGSSTVLNEVTVRKINLNICQARYMTHQNKTSKSRAVTSSSICAGILDVGGKGTARGDSGGPLLYQGIVVGVTSWGAPKFPGVYARVANYTNWINYTMNDSQLQIQAPNGTGNGSNPDNTGSLSSKVGAIMMVTSLLYLILSV